LNRRDGSFIFSLVSENSPVYFASTKTLSSESLLHLWSWILRWAINLNPKLASIQSHLVSPLSPHPAPLYFSLLSNKTSVGPCTTFVIRPRECSEPLRLITTLPILFSECHTVSYPTHLTSELEYALVIEWGATK
jgi:hypothetical protein